MEILAPLLVGLAVGVVVGALGAGGGILSVPILVFLLDQDPYAAAASSLVIVAVTALTSIGHHARRGTVRWRAGLAFGALSILGAFAGTRLSLLVPPEVLMYLFAGLLAVVAIAMVRRGATARRREKNPPPASADLPARGALATVLAAMATGVLTGFFGVGGGFIVVPVLVLVLRLDLRAAAGTSLLVMIIAAISGLLSRLGTPVQVDWLLTGLFTLGSAVGGLLGGPVASRARASTLTFAFATLLALVAAFTAAQTALGAV